LSRARIFSPQALKYLPLSRPKERAQRQFGDVAEQIALGDIKASWKSGWIRFRFLDGVDVLF
jgi:hypothetical protein